MTYRDLGIGRYISATPSKRFPVYTRGNAGEVYPEVFYPLSYSLAGPQGEEAMRNAVARSGLMSAAELTDHTGPHGDSDVSVALGVFGGYAYLNLSLNRVVALRVPGGSLDELDRGLLGNADLVPPHVTHPDDSDRRASARALLFIWKTINAKDVLHLEADKREVELFAIERGDPGDATDASLAETLTGFTDFGIRLFESHLFTSMQASTAVTTLGRLCADALGDPDVAMQLLAGIGEVESAAPAGVMFHLGKLAVANPKVDAAFSAGLDGLEGRLHAEPDAEAFLAEFSSFLDEFGSRGPNEWEIACDTWGTDHSLPLALIDRMRGAADDHDPTVQRERLAADRHRIVADARQKMGFGRRKLFDRVLHSATMFSQARERSKTTVVRSIQVSRLAALELGRRVADRSDAAADDIWYVVDDELEVFIDNPAPLATVIAERRAARAELAKRVPPFSFVGAIPSPETWPLRSEHRADAVEVGDQLRGVSGCPGKAVGIARVVLDPSEPGDLGPGDVLIAPLTDPSWTPLFVPAEAVVVDVGAQMSHAVIVSRELGIPCVVSVTDATMRIPDGATIEVDGSTGTVTVLSLP